MMRILKRMKTTTKSNDNEDGSRQEPSSPFVPFLSYFPPLYAVIFAL